VKPLVMIICGLFDLAAEVDDGQFGKSPHRSVASRRDKHP
jgi:hypothetical protein